MSCKAFIKEVFIKDDSVKVDSVNNIIKNFYNYNDDYFSVFKMYKKLFQMDLQNSSSYFEYSISVLNAEIEELKKTYLAQIPAGRFGQPDDIANACVFLASDEASYINGQTLHINGGMGRF